MSSVELERAIQASIELGRNPTQARRSELLDVLDSIRKDTQRLDSIMNEKSKERPPMARQLEWDGDRSKCKRFGYHSRLTGYEAADYSRELSPICWSEDAAKQECQEKVEYEIETSINPAFLAYVESLERENVALRKKVAELEDAVQIHNRHLKNALNSIADFHDPTKQKKDWTDWMKT